MKFLIELNDLSLKERSRLATKTEDKQLLNALAEDEEWTVRKAVAENANVTLDILLKLIQDEDEDVATTAYQNLRKQKS